MADKIQKKAAAPMPYNDAIRVDDEPVENSTALATSGGTYKAIQEALMHVKKLDFSGWDSGHFVEYLENDQIISFDVTFDNNNRPILISDNMNHSMQIVW